MQYLYIQYNQRNIYFFYNINTEYSYDYETALQSSDGLSILMSACTVVSTIYISK